MHRLDDMPETVLGIFDFLDTPALLINSRGKIVSINPSTSGLFQYVQDEVVGMDVGEIAEIPPEVLGRVFGTSCPSLPGSTPTGQRATGIEAHCKKKNGDTFLANVSMFSHAADDSVLLVIQNVSGQKRLQEKAAQRTKELSIFRAFAEILTRHAGIDRVLQETIEMLISLMGVDKGWIYLFDEKAGCLCLAAQKNLPADLLERIDRLTPGDGLSGKVFASGRPLLVKRASEDPRVVYRDAGMESMAAVPLSSRGTVLGVLEVTSSETSFFTSMDMQLLMTIGNQLGGSIEYSNLIGQLNENMEQIGLINELSSMVNSSLSIGTVFRMMVSEIRKLIDYDRASLLLYSEKDNNLLIFALSTDMETVLKKGMKAPLETTSAGWVIKHNRPWINDDLLKRREFPLDDRLLMEGIRSTISVPLFRDKILGVFNLDSTTPSKYSEKDLEILLPVAKHLSIALENALLFEEISREKKEWERTFDAITDMVWTEDRRKCVRRVNKALLLRTGLSMSEIVGRQCRELWEKIGIGETRDLCSDTLSTKGPSFMELRGSGGNIFHVWAYPLMDEEGQLYATVHYLKDVTSRKRLEQQLVRADKLASLGTLVAGVAHEINNPLGIIAAYSEALLDRAQDEDLLRMEQFEDFPEYLRTIHQEIFRCKEILRSLLEFARPHGVTFRKLDINELIKEVILLVNHKATRLRHKIALSLERDLPKIYGDPGSLRQFFLNFIINSLYFTPEGGSIIIRTEMDVNHEENGPASPSNAIKVSIIDTGPGIPHDIVHKIFDPFFTTKPVGEGTGLGLAICHKIAEEHGGNVDVESELGWGTRFTIRLPARGEDDKGSRS